jgi:hypothetical protein
MSVRRGGRRGPAPPKTLTWCSDGELPERGTSRLLGRRHYFISARQGRRPAPPVRLVHAVQRGSGRIALPGPLPFSAGSPALLGDAERLVVGHRSRASCVVQASFMPDGVTAPNADKRPSGRQIDAGSPDGSEAPEREAIVRITLIRNFNSACESAEPPEARGYVPGGRARVTDPGARAERRAARVQPRGKIRPYDSRRARNSR